ncbi:MAG: hypothetical protein WC728_08385 [Elusimicrobiota bacterium]
MPRLGILLAPLLLCSCSVYQAKPMRILLVGYGWYDGIPAGQINNAEMVARSLHGAAIRPKGSSAAGEVYSIVVPVTWAGAMPPVYDAIRTLKPDIVVGLGTAPGAPGIRPEPCGANWSSGEDADPKDPAREVCRNEPIEPGGPPYRCGSLPYLEIVRSMSKAGIPAYMGRSTDPAEPEGCKDPASKDPQPTATTGWYLCNWMTYLLPKYVEENRLDADVGFIHIPTRPEYAAKDPKDPDWSAEASTRTAALVERPPAASLSFDQTLRGIRTALEECVRARAQERPPHDL